MKKYRLLKRKGEGTFSEVLSAQNIKSGEMVAIKCMKQTFSSIEQVNGLREIQALRRLSPHPNVVTLHEVLYDKPTGRLALVFELMQFNLYELIRGRKRHLDPQLVRIYAWQMMRSVDYMHSRGVFHRDIKPENVLVESSYDVYTGLKLADFGSCRGIHSKQPYTEYISTRWYRAPECLLTDGYYSYKMDIWGAACILFEISALFPLFPGTDEKDQIRRIHAVLGTPSERILAKFKKHASAHMDFNFPDEKGTGLGTLAPHLDAQLLDLLTHMLAYDPDERFTSSQSLAHPYFDELRKVPIPPEIQAELAAAQKGGRSKAKDDGQSGSVDASATAGKGAAAGGEGESKTGDGEDRQQQRASKYATASGALATPAGDKDPAAKATAAGAAAQSSAAAASSGTAKAEAAAAAAVAAAKKQLQGGGGADAAARLAAEQQQQRDKAQAQQPAAAAAAQTQRGVAKVPGKADASGGVAVANGGPATSKAASLLQPHAGGPGVPPSPARGGAAAPSSLLQVTMRRDGPADAPGGGGGGQGGAKQRTGSDVGVGGLGGGAYSLTISGGKPTAKAPGAPAGGAPGASPLGSKAGAKPGSHASTGLLLSPNGAGGGGTLSSTGGVMMGGASSSVLLSSSVALARGGGGGAGGVVRVQPTMDPNTVLSGVAVTKPSGAVGIATKAALQPRRPHGDVAAPAPAPGGGGGVHTPISGGSDAYKARQPQLGAAVAGGAAAAQGGGARAKPSTLGGAGSPAVARQQQAAVAQAAADAAAAIAALDSRTGAPNARHALAGGGGAAAAARVHGPRTQDVVADARAALGETRRSVGRAPDAHAPLGGGAGGRAGPAGGGGGLGLGAAKQSFTAAGGLSALMAELGGGGGGDASLGSGRGALHAGGGGGLTTRNAGGAKLAPVADTSSRRLAGGGDDVLGGSLGGSKGALALQPLLGGGAAAGGPGEDRDRRRQGALDALRGAGASGRPAVMAVAAQPD